MELTLTCIGHIGQDAVRKTTGNNAVVNFSVAHTEKYERNGVTEENTTWVKCAIWERDGKQNGVVPLLKKGILVKVEGKPSVSAFIGQDNTAQASLELTVYSTLILTPKAKDTATASTGNNAPPVEGKMNDAAKKATKKGAEITDDLPF